MSFFFIFVISFPMIADQQNEDLPGLLEYY
jgi:hypothetical protein